MTVGGGLNLEGKMARRKGSIVRGGGGVEGAGLVRINWCVLLKPRDWREMI
jgi:hypothetical protein